MFLESNHPHEKIRGQILCNSFRYQTAAILESKVNIQDREQNIHRDCRFQEYLIE